MSDSPKRIQAVLKITVTYDCEGATEAEIKQTLNKAANFLASEGLLSGDLGEEGFALVDDWSSDVETKIVNP